MKPDSALVKGTRSQRKIYSLSEPGKQYAIYLYRPDGNQLELSIPAGTYSVEWLNPVTGKYIKAEPEKSAGKIILPLPGFAEDVALRLLKNPTAKNNPSCDSFLVIFTSNEE